jgi:hypothetical protein
MRYILFDNQTYICNCGSLVQDGKKYAIKLPKRFANEKRKEKFQEQLCESCFHNISKK